MGGTPSSSTTVANNDPWEGVQPYLTDVFNQGQSAYHSGAGSQVWGGPTLAGLSGDTQSAMGTTRGTAQGMMNSGLNWAPLNYTNNMSANNGMSSAMNPAMSTLSGFQEGGAVNPHMQAMIDDNNSRMMNRIQSSMSGSGRYGSFGMMDQAIRSMGAANAPILAQAYENDQNRSLQAANSQMGYLDAGLNRGMQAAGMAPALTDLAYDPARRMGAVGAITDQRAQTELDQSRALWEQAQQMPWSQLGKYSASLSGMSGLIPNTGNSTTTTNGGSSGAMPYIGAGLSLLGMLSDERTKKDIVDIGGAVDARTGAPVKAWRYKWEDDGDPLKVGPMAQDVQKHRPELVGQYGGLLYIKD